MWGHRDCVVWSDLKAMHVNMKVKHSNVLPQRLLSGLPVRHVACLEDVEHRSLRRCRFAVANRRILRCHTTPSRRTGKLGSCCCCCRPQCGGFLFCCQVVSVGTSELGGDLRLRWRHTGGSSDSPGFSRCEMIESRRGDVPGSTTYTSVCCRVCKCPKHEHDT